MYTALTRSLLSNLSDRIERLKNVAIPILDRTVVNLSDRIERGIVVTACFTAYEYESKR